MKKELFFAFILAIGLVSCVDQKETELLKLNDSTKVPITPTVITTVDSFIRVQKCSYIIRFKIREDRFAWKEGIVLPSPTKLTGELGIFYKQNIVTVRDPKTNSDIDNEIYSRNECILKDSIITTDSINTIQLDSTLKKIHQNIETQQVLIEKAVDENALEMRYSFASPSVPAEQRNVYYGISGHAYERIIPSKVIKQIKITSYNVTKVYSAYKVSHSKK